MDFGNFFRGILPRLFYCPNHLIYNIKCIHIHISVYRLVPRKQIDKRVGGDALSAPCDFVKQNHIAKGDHL